MYVLTDNITAHKFPYSLVELRKDNPNTSFPSQMSDGELEDWGVFPVVPQNPPSYDQATENLNQADPVLVDGEWQQAWVVSEASAEEIAERLDQQSSLVRQERNARLSACDWTQLTDAPVVATAWAAYRQQLRDVTAQEAFPWAVLWPAQPEA